MGAKPQPVTLECGHNALYDPYPYKGDSVFCRASKCRTWRTVVISPVVRSQHQNGKKYILVCDDCDLIRYGNHVPPLSLQMENHALRKRHSARIRTCITGKLVREYSGNLDALDQTA